MFVCNNNVFSRERFITFDVNGMGLTYESRPYNSIVYEVGAINYYTKIALSLVTSMVPVISLKDNV